MEPLLEPILRSFRIKRVLREIKKVPQCMLLDIGCGVNHVFLSSIKSHIKLGIGIDFKAIEFESDTIKTFKMTLDDKLNFSDNSFDVVTLLAVLEHLEKPVEICHEIERVLKPGGKLVLTVPSIRSQPVLEFLSYKIGIVDSAEIRDHKKYYDRNELDSLFSRFKDMIIVQHHFFQFGMNNFCVIEKSH